MHATKILTKFVRQYTREFLNAQTRYYSLKSLLRNKRSDAFIQGFFQIKTFSDGFYNKTASSKLRKIVFIIFSLQ